MTTMSDNKLHKNNQKISFQYMLLTNRKTGKLVFMCFFRYFFSNTAKCDCDLMRIHCILSCSFNVYKAFYAHLGCFRFLHSIL